MPRIATIRSKDEWNNEVVALVLSQDAVNLGPNGDPWCGITLSPEQARALAQRLHSYALEIDNREVRGTRTSSLSLLHISSIVVLHDGSLAGDHAFQAALQFAARSLASLDFIGVSGLHPQTLESFTTTDDCDSQEGWRNRLANVYEERAIAEGVSFHWKLVSAADPCVLLDILYGVKCDLMVIPKTMIRFGIHGERLLSSIVERRDVNVFVCP